LQICIFSARRILNALVDCTLLIVLEFRTGRRWHGVEHGVDFVHFAQVRVERAFLGEPLEAHRALIRFLSSMHPHVHLEVVLHRKAFAAQITLKRLLSGMRSNVVLEAVLLLEPSMADTAHIRREAGMDSNMLLQVAVARKFLPAISTHFLVVSRAVIEQHLPGSAQCATHCTL